VAEQDGGERASFQVQGLDCAEEVAVLRKALGGEAGILQLDFDILSARMTVSYDESLISAGQIEAVVATTGMKAIPWVEARERPPDTYWNRRGHLLMTTASGILLLGGFCTHWVLHGGFVHALAAGEGTHHHVFPAASVVLYVLSAVAGAWFVVPKAVQAARRFSPDMNLLMVVAILGAAGIGEWFEAATVAFLFALALLLEQWSIGRARHAIGVLLDLSPTTARFIPEGEDDVHEGPVEAVEVGATVLVRPGERIPLDGVVTEGATAVNEAPITGESMPVDKEPGAEVFAGTVNGDVAFRFKATRTADDTTLARIIHLVEEAHSRRAPAEQWVEGFARYYTPAVMGLAAALMLLPPLLLSASWAVWFYRGLVLLVIACPCALVISTPVSIVSGLASAARNGVLVKGGAYLEAIGHLRGVAVDKTGTLTYGRPSVQEVMPFGDHSRRELLAIAAGLEGESEHPLATAVLERARVDGIEPLGSSAHRALQGKGAEAMIEGRLFWIGSHRLMDEKGQETPEVHDTAVRLEDAGHSVMAIGNDRHVCGLISVADGVRKGVTETVRALKGLGVRRIEMLTGDNEGTARAVAEATGVDAYESELLPEGKVQAVEAMVRELRYVAMVGDGVNDAPAMAAATVGIAMGTVGTDVAIETADVALMADELDRLPWVIRHSRRTLVTIKQNIVFALSVKFAFVAMAVVGAATLWMAIAADMGTSLLVIFNSLRLLHPGRR
jgi:Cd2+/Zn2+-exporting ATPase